jgi:hypothetical protein
MLTVYVLKNGVGCWYDIFFFFSSSSSFFFYTKLAKSSFLCRFRGESVNVFVLTQFDLSTFSSSTNAFPNEFTVRSYEYCTCQHWNFTGYKKIKQRRISFVLGYLRMILWKNSTAISIKHRILATFNIKKNSILTACMPLRIQILNNTNVVCYS